MNSRYQIIHVLVMVKDTRVYVLMCRYETTHSLNHLPTPLSQTPLGNLTAFCIDF